MRREAERGAEWIHRGDPVRREVARATAALGIRGRLLVAASGGLDSTVLAHVLTSLARQLGLTIGLAHVHHGLRGADSDADQAAVEALGRRLGIEVQVRRVHPAALRRGVASRRRPTLQEAARTLRYAALREMAGALEARHVVTAHHADDQVETVLLRLLRGTGPDGLGGIPERSPDGLLVRPLLRVPRADLLAHAQAHGLEWREDASNDSNVYARNRLRREWLPGLAQAFNPRLLRAVADLAEAQRRDSEWIGAELAREAASRLSSEGRWLRIDTKDWAALPEALSRRLAREALARCGAGRDVSRTHLERVQAFLRSASPGRVLELPGGLHLRRERDGFRLGPAGSTEAGC
jgi:tRNA(Ile)-lysidine synthase